MLITVCDRCSHPITGPYHVVSVSVQQLTIGENCPDECWMKFKQWRDGPRRIKRNAEETLRRNKAILEKAHG